MTPAKWTPDDGRQQRPVIGLFGVCGRCGAPRRLSRKGWRITLVCSAREPIVGYSSDAARQAHTERLQGIRQSDLLTVADECTDPETAALLLDWDGDR